VGARRRIVDTKVVSRQLGQRVEVLGVVGLDPSTNGRKVFSFWEGLNPPAAIAGERTTEGARVITAPADILRVPSVALTWLRRMARE
jgi:hypothetical protein